MGRLSDLAKWVAVALLNHADDEGYFRADPAIVRGAIAPFTEDSLIIHGALSECSRAGWLEIREHPTEGILGKVVNFTKHQRINRPNPSKFKDYWEFSECSVSAHGGLSEDSHPEGKGREGNREQGTGKGSAEPEETMEPVEIPDDLTNLHLYASDLKLIARWHDLRKSWTAAFPRGWEWVMGEVRRAHAWEVANPTRAKKDRARFLAGWLTRAQDRPVLQQQRPFGPDRGMTAMQMDELAAQLREQGR